MRTLKQVGSRLAAWIAYPFMRLGITRDSLILKLAVAGSVLGFMSQKRRPDTWGWTDWMQAAYFAFGLVMAQLGKSLLRGSGSESQVANPSRFR
jgi:hypothetical protein